MPLTQLALLMLPLAVIGVLLLRAWSWRQAVGRKLSSLTSGAAKEARREAKLITLRGRSTEIKICLTAFCAILAASLMVNLNPYLTILILAVAIPMLWWTLRRLRLRRMRRDFASYFAEAVDSLNRAIQAGVPVEKALTSVADLYHGELSNRFRRLVQLLDLGTPFREALNDFSDQLDMPDVDFFCAVLALSRESGSRLSPLLTSLTRTLRERQAVDRKLLGLTAESRGAARILLVLPVIVIGLQIFLNPSHLTFLMSDPVGRLLIGYAAVSMGAGFLIIQRMSRLTEA